MEINFLVKGTQFGLEIYPGQQAEITHKMTFKFLAWSDVNLGMLIPYFSKNSLNTNKKCTVWTFLCSKIALLPLPIPESNRTCTSEVLFFPQITFWRYKAI